MFQYVYYLGGMHSTFSLRIAIPLLLALPMSVMLVIISKAVFGRIMEEPAWLLLLGFFLLCWLWVVLGELRVRVIRVELERDRIMVRGFAGLGPVRVYYFDELDGYETNILPSRSGSYEYLFIKKDGRRVVRLSQFYHSNYAELKAFIAKRLKGHDTHSYSLTRELKDMFG